MRSTTTWKFYLTPEEAWEGMYEACEHAKYSIDFEQYIFVDDLVGRRFLDLFIKKAKAGVRVRFLLDAAGSRRIAGTAILDELTAAGVKFQFFNPIYPYWRWVHRLFQKFLRSHRKLLIVDGVYGFAGGVGVRATMAGRRDTHVRLHGPVVDEIAAAFERSWSMTAAGKRIFGFSRPFTTTSEFMLLTNSPKFKQRFTYWTLVRMFRGARKYIYITTPYFVPDWRIFRALKGAARRGVDVRVMVPNSPDWRLVRFGNSSFYSRAMKSGIKIFEFGPEFNHAKTCVIDDSWACVGSTNMDSLSLLFNYEADIASTNKRFIEEMKWQFIEDSKRTTLIEYLAWHHRPFWHKLVEQLVRPLHRFM